MLANKLRELRKDSDTGFSLTELMVSILIIGILAAIAVPIFMNQQKVALRQEVRQDVLNTAANISQWQLNRDEINSVPGQLPSTPADVTKLTVKTNASTTITIEDNGVNIPEYRQVCVEGSRNIGGSYIVSYNLTTKDIKEGSCTFPVPDEEIYG